MVITTQALIARINRKLAPQGTALRTSRGARARQECGDYYTLDVRDNVMGEAHVDLESLGRELGVLRVGEELEGG